jgi:hypothetical protein
MKAILKSATTLTLTFICLAAPAVIGSTIVQWGELGGDTTILTSTGNTRGQNQFPATYDPATLVNPANTVGGYDVNAVGRTNVFSGADNGNFSNTFSDNAAGDYMQLINNFGNGNAGTFLSMVAWESGEFLPGGGTLDSFKVGFHSRDNGDDSTVSFLLETSSGWFASNQTFLNNDKSFYLQVDENIADLTWAGFDGFEVTAGTGTADISDIQSVGFYSTTESASGFSGNFVNYFEVTAVPEPSSSALLGLCGFALLMRRRR